MAKRRRKSRKSRGKWCRVSKSGHVVGHHRKKSSAKRARKAGQRVRKC